MKLVLDTNVLVSGLICAYSAPGRIVDLLRAGALEPVVDDRVLAEYADVLRRDYLRRYFSAADAEVMIEFLEHHCVHVLAEVVVTGLPDVGDCPFLELALTARVTLVSGNSRHFPEEKRRGCSVLTPGEFVEWWSDQQYGQTES